MTAVAPHPTRAFLPRFLGAVLLRLGGGVALLVALSFLVFLLIHLAPGDLVTNILGPKNTSPEAVAAVTAKYRLDDPLLAQYAAWLGNAVTGDWGTSFRQQAPVAAIVAARAATTVALVSLAFVIALVTAIPLGIASALRAGRSRDRVIGLVTIVGVSAPSFVVAFVLMYVFASVLGWFPLYGYGDGGLDTLRHLVLPAVALAIGLGALLVKITRSVLIRELAQEHITAARARGESDGAVLRLALRGASIPIATSAGLVVTYLVAGTILVENVFAIPGLGRLLFDSVVYKDIPTVQATTLLVAAAIVVVSILVDVLYVVLDPRVRRQEVAR
ncbi:ABC transporter permease [Microbacterium ulmi]|uniref:ABC transporter permease n=1 Tax=Microbacterium ulmi TaxID=179095 RepID=A0A7Y2LX97_9MICO|nr:ABC transporter permease [Microbacterium ulmi]NII68225.1 peptide/nickel transport system permease protein [Microbacterium ulmi]NNH02297.1 ABC transporter permease [Microbacterium ulmi]